MGCYALHQQIFPTQGSNLGSGIAGGFFFFFFFFTTEPPGKPASGCGRPHSLPREDPAWPHFLGGLGRGPEDLSG